MNLPPSNAGQFRTFLESLRAPVATMAGLDVDAVLIYAQQDLYQFVLGATASHQCAVALGITRWATKADASTVRPPLTVSLSVRVWTPETVLSDNAPTTLDVAEAITRGLHGRVPPEGSPGRAMVPQFAGSVLAVETRDDTRWLVAELVFSLPMKLNPPPPPD
jgi:hypothetical protein